MLFNSYEFLLIFLPITWLLYFGAIKLRGARWALGFLFIASLVFYAYWDKRYLLLLLGSIVFNFLIGKAIYTFEKKKMLLYLGIAGNLSLLAYYKYTAFFLSAVNEGLNTSFLIPEIVLPLGISFFTFTQLAYLLDVYRDDTIRYDILTYCLFVTIFPHLIAGPILYHKDMIPQFTNPINFAYSSRNMAEGLFIFAIGLFKKVLIADSLSIWVNPVFNNAQSLTFAEAWAGAVGYTLQLYFDFSGYSEMAIGLGLLFNFRLPYNFNSPYRATSITEFWRRWHITLSNFLKTDLYIPLGGNRKSELFTVRNVLITMILGGAWHGAGWTFIAWGALHGLYIVINRLWRQYGIALPKALAWGITFTCVVIGWVFFRANSMTDALAMIQTMMGAKGISFAIQLEVLKVSEIAIPCILLLIICLRAKNTQERVSTFQPSIFWAFCTAGLLIVSILHFNNASEFLYFQF